MQGAILSDCLKPCKTTSVAVVLNDRKIVDGNRSKIDITFSNNVLISTTDFRKFDIVSFLSGLGGQMGFWLGCGVLQMLEISINTFKKVFTKEMVMRRTKNTSN